MSKPTEEYHEALNRFGKYLFGRPREIKEFKYQRKLEDVEVWTDTDFAGCRKSRNSTSGGIVFLGNHAVKSWSSTQAALALSSGEAEYNGLVKGSSVAIGIREMLRDLGIDLMWYCCQD